MISSIVKNLTLPLNYYFNFIFFNILHKNLTNKFDYKMSNNFTAMVHASRKYYFSSKIYFK